MAANADIPALLRQRSDIWRGGASSSAFRDASIATGFPVLDDALGGGWPTEQITEIFPDSPGAAMHLLLPLLKRLSREENWLAWIAPPLIPYPPGLLHRGVALERLLVIQPDSTKERLWAAEQCLRSGACSVVLLWLEHSDFLTSRRLQLAAHSSKTPTFCLLPSGARHNASAAAQRLAVHLQRCPDMEPNPWLNNYLGLAIEILKCRGGSGGRRLHLSVTDQNHASHARCAT